MEAYFNDIPSNVKQIDSISYGIQSNHFKDMEGFFQECDYDESYPSNFVKRDTSSGSNRTKIELGSKQAHNFFRHNSDEEQEDADHYDEPIFDSEDEEKINAPQSVKDRLSRSGDQLLKDKALNTPQYLLARCTCGNNCVHNATYGMTDTLRNDYWGKWNEPAPTSMQRGLLNWNILSRFYAPLKNDFQFCISSNDHNNVLVCEAAYLILLGYNNSPNASEASNQWRRIKSWFKKTEGKSSYQEFKSKRIVESDIRGEPAKQKHDHAVAFIINFAKEFGDKIPTKEGSTGTDKFVVPYSDTKAFHAEYLVYCNNTQAFLKEQASLSTFRRAYQWAYTNNGIRMMNCKGAMNTCEICNNASDLLRYNKKFTKPQVDIIQKFRQLHLQQQSAERRFLDDRKHLALTRLDEFGNPINALFFIDGMTQYTCQTPKFKKPSKGDRTIESRIIGVEVYCGPIKTVFIYRTDSLVSSGSNIMVEIVRQAMIDLCKLLNDKQLCKPTNLWLQFDNCGENKNKEMFCYVSLLVELFLFKEVEICFLIVGHTHASIDQYFSVISKKIYNCDFIGSPLALLELIRIAHNASWVQEPVIREIHVYYDMVTFFEPYRNKKIKYYAIPHYFVFKPSLCGVAYMQYKLFSTYRQLNPPEPHSIYRTLDELTKLDINEINVPAGIDLLQGRDELLKHILVPDQASRDRELLLNEVIVNKSQVAVISEVNVLLEHFNRICNLSHKQLCRRMEWEAEEALLEPSTARFTSGRVMPETREVNKRNIEAIQSQNDKENGYICWLLDSSGRSSLPPISDAKPVPFNPESILKAFNTSEVGDVNEEEVLFQPDSLLANRPREHRKEDDPQKRSKKVWNNAKEIASTASWFMSQLEHRIQVNRNRENYCFDHYSINKQEEEWYSSRITARAVLSILTKCYSDMPDWEPLPQTILSPNDIIIIQQRKQDYLNRVASARTIAESLLVRPGQSSSEQDHIIDYGTHNTMHIQEQLQKKRRITSNNKGASKPTVFYKCDVATCESLVSADLVGCCKVTQTRNNVEVACCRLFRFCGVHCHHDSHSGKNSKRQRRERFDAALHNLNKSTESLNQTVTVIFKCDIEECIEPAIDHIVPCVHQHCEKYVFCCMHGPHESHSANGQLKRLCKEIYSDKDSNTSSEQLPVDAPSTISGIAAADVTMDVIIPMQESSDIGDLESNYKAVDKRDDKMLNQLKSLINRFKTKQNGFNFHASMLDCFNIRYYKDHLSHLVEMYKINLDSNVLSLDLSSKANRLIYINAVTDALVALLT